MAVAFGQSITKRIKGVSIGQRFGRLVVFSFFREERNGYQRTFARCECDCGNPKEACPSRLRAGITKSCGCLRDEGPANAIVHGETMGDMVSAEYGIYKGMMARCFDTNCPAYRYYGAKGITVCERWKNSIEAFIEDVGRRPSKGHSLDRFPDRKGDYRPGNFRWATWIEQAQNKDSAIFIEHNGEEHCISEWSRILGIPLQTISRRLLTGWTVGRALTVRDGRRKIS